MLNAEQSIVDEVEQAINLGSAEKSLETVKRVTELFLASAGSFNSEQIELFDSVLERLIKTIEIRAIADVSARIALAETSVQLAGIAQAPPTVIRRLARNDEITVAGPVLTESSRLSAEDLVEIAKTKSEQHLLAISGRWWLTEIVTDALLARHYPSVSRRLVKNPGARVSASGFAVVVAQAESDPELAVDTGIRVDLPTELRTQLLRNATDAVRTGCCRARRRTCSRKSAIRSPRSRPASIARWRHRATLPRPSISCRSSTPAANSMKPPCSPLPRRGNMKRPSQRLALLSKSSIEVIRPLMQSLRDDGVLIPCKVAGLNWEITSAILECRYSTGSMAPHELAKAKAQFAKIAPRTRSGC